MFTTRDEHSGDPVYHKLRRLIIEGYYPPETRLVEEKLAHDFGVSRTPIRQALARVAAEGLIHTYPNRGAVVCSFTRKDLIQTFDLRAVLEGYAAQQAAQHIDQQQLERLEQLAGLLEATEERTFDSREETVHFLVEHNQHFHSIIVSASQNRRLSNMLTVVVDVPMQFRSFYWYTDDERRVSNFFHRSILSALHRRDGERARAMMQEHIYRGRDFLLQRIDTINTTASAQVSQEIP
ncbi:MAG: DNA-binding transcriptional regulator, GntR family [Chloroflexi bacterium AL-W]|nr:DNA-binding transcriptional regulator, GntR family [Chloroflexi bacterium AL-N1]NOK68223.1 DNA-binding transcriptional regulator, GntR family [Chloroflexi bacterium AL-N10]NOK73869.1 DNA-binding transcriptional regulator, GntR family [Chloroflexi bacterium AL-N5]NOK82837.1 DNA-binding transcriptional regulator, GntR family [Chloroflexi bacterium AL-W]NOK90359.1 DNA-binding transcriptional regulator, GntR family [Chloroflexi bacterium AL-N15]